MTPRKAVLPDAYRVLFEANPQPMYVLARDTRVVLAANEAFRALHGLDDIHGLNADDLRPDHERTRFREVIQRANGHLADHGRWVHHRTDGSLLHVDVTTHGLAFDGRDALLILCTDVTGQVHSESLHRAGEQRYRMIFEGSTNAILVTNEDGDVVEANPAACELSGLSRRELLHGSSLRFYAHPEERAYVTAALDSVGRLDNHEFHIRRADGEERICILNASVLQDPGGGRLYVSLLHDITERRQAETALRELADALRLSEALYRTVIESTHDLISIVAYDGTMRFVSPASTAMLGDPASALVGADLFARVHPEDVDRLREAFARGLADPSLRAREVYRFRHRDGRWLWLESVGRNLVEEPSIAGVLVNTRDVTVRKELEMQLLQSQKMEAVGRLAGGVAHDFNNVLTVISGHTQFMLLELEEEDPLREGLTEIQRASQRAAALTRQLLAFSKRQVVQQRPLDLNEVTADLERMLRRLMGEDVEVQSRLGVEPIHITADEGQVHQVILNLGVNARDAMPEGGTFTIETFAEPCCPHCRTSTGGPGGWAVLRAVDSGVGIPPEILDTIFEPFFTTKEKGTGLGLSTVYGIVEQAGGHIHVDSRVGSGTAFEIRFPITAEFPTASAEESAGPPAGGAETILLVEDDLGRPYHRAHRADAQRLPGPGGVGRPAGEEAPGGARTRHRPPAHRPGAPRRKWRETVRVRPRHAPPHPGPVHFRVRRQRAPAACAPPGLRAIPREAVPSDGAGPQGARDSGWGSRDRLSGGGRPATPPGRTRAARRRAPAPSGDRASRRDRSGATRPRRRSQPGARSGWSRRRCG